MKPQNTVGQFSFIMSEHFPVMESGEQKSDQEFLESRDKQGRRCYIPARFVFVAVLGLGTLLNVILRTSLPISMTAMVRRNVTGPGGGVQPDTCDPPGSEAAVPQNSTGGVLQTGDYDWDELTQSYVLTAATYGTLASSLLGGRLAELWSPKYMFTICYGVSAVVYMLLPVTADWSVAAVIAFQAISGLFSGPLQAVMMLMCAAWFPPQERQILYAMVMAALSLGGIASNFLTGNLVDIMGWRFVFYLFSSLVTGWTLLWMVFVFDSPNSHPRISEEERVYITDSVNKDESQTTARLPWKEMLLSPPVWAHIIMGLPSTWLSATFSNYLPTYMRNVLNYSTAMLGNISAISSILGLLSMMIFGFLSQWIRRKKYLSHLTTYHVFNGISTLLPAALLISLSFVGCNHWAINSMITFIGVFSAAYIGGSQLNQMDLAVNYTGTIVGFTNTLYGVVGIIAPTITGALTNRRQTLTAWRTIFYIAAGVKIVPFFIYLIFGSVDEQPWNRVEKEEKDETQLNERLTTRF